MIVRLKEKNLDYLDLTPERPYFVIGIEADDYRILNDFGKPYLYPPNLFDVIEPREPSTWITEYGDDCERYSYPPVLNEAGFFEDYFDGKDRAVSWFWHVINKRLSELSSGGSDAFPNSEPVNAALGEGKMKKLLDIAAEIIQAQASIEPMSTRQIEQSLIKTFSTLQSMQRAEEAQVAKKEPRESIQDDKIVCLECGSEMRQLTTKHLTSHNLTPREYKQKWGFSLKQSLSAKSLTKARIMAAKKRGLSANLVKFLEGRLQKKAETAAAGGHAAKQKVGRPTVKRRPKARKTA
jgi:predicted transcriptional regulator